MKCAVIVAVFAMSLTACASTAMQRYVGQSISEAFLAYGPPENVFDLPDGRRAFQFYWGGSSGVIPGQANTTITPTGYSYNVTTTSIPATFVESKGCLVSLIARPSGNDFVVEEYRIPRRLVC